MTLSLTKSNDMASPHSAYLQDLKLLESLDTVAIEKILELLNQTAPNRTTVEAVVPVFFLRLLHVYKVKIFFPERCMEVRDEIAPVVQWFEEHIPDVFEKPGIDSFMRAAAQALKDHSASPSGSSPLKKGVSRSLGRINALSHTPFLASEELLPSLRVFFMNNEEVILDSSGDWDDWLFVVSSLLRVIDKQAKSIGSFPEAWASVPWDNVRDYMLEIRKCLESLELQLQEHDPARSDDSTE